MSCNLVTAICILMVIVAITHHASAQSEGWKMTDRFYGFRYELFGNNWDPNLLDKILSEADNYFCFGRTQLSPANTVVGEARCSKARGPIFQEKLKQISNNIQRSEILV